MSGTDHGARSPREILGIGDRAKVLLLGTFHFADQGLDAYKPEHSVDILSGQRQTEVEEVLGLLAEFRPTKIAVENPPESEARLNQRYEAYRNGTFSLTANETHQLGFRLAATLNHDRLYPIDEPQGRLYAPWEDLFEYARKKLGLPEANRSEEELDDLLSSIRGKGWVERFERLNRHDDQLKMKQSLREHLLYWNSEDHIQASHGYYLTWLDGDAGDYAIVDHISGWWYNRNLRIFANLKRITESPDDRILVIIGAGHLPILRHTIQHSPEHELVEVKEYLA